MLYFEYHEILSSGLPDNAGPCYRMLKLIVAETPIQLGNSYGSSGWLNTAKVVLFGKELQQTLFLRADTFFEKTYCPDSIQ